MDRKKERKGQARWIMSIQWIERLIVSLIHEDTVCRQFEEGRGQCSCELSRRSGIKVETSGQKQ